MDNYPRFANLKTYEWDGIIYVNQNLAQWKSVSTTLFRLMKAEAKNIGVPYINSVVKLGQRILARRIELQPKPPVLLQPIFGPVAGGNITAMIYEGGIEVYKITSKDGSWDFVNQRFFQQLTNPQREIDGWNMAIATQVGDLDSISKLEFPRKFSPKFRPHNAVQFFQSMVNTTRYELIDAVYFYLYPPNADPMEFKLFESLGINCAISEIIKECPKFHRRLLQYSNENKEELEKNGCTAKNLEELSKMLHLTFTVYSCAGVWFDNSQKNNGKYKNIKLFAYANHASKFVPIEKAKQVKYVEYSEITKLHQSIHQAKRFYATFLENEYSKRFSLHGFHAGDIIYKAFRPSEVTKNPADDNEPFYYSCHDEDQLRYKVFLRENNIRPLQEPYFEIFRAADHHLTTQQFSDYKVGDIYDCLDMNKAFPSFKTNPLYEKFKLTVGYVSLYSVDASHYGEPNDMKETKFQEIIDRPGVSFLSEVQFADTFSAEFVRKTGWIQARQWYNNIVLYHAVTSGWIVSCKIDKTVVCKKSEDLVFPWENETETTGFRFKQKNNAFIGRLISGGKDDSYKQCFVGSLDDINQINFTCKQDPNYIGHYSETLDDTQWITQVEFKSNEKNDQLFQIHGCILAYQQTTMMSKMVEVISNGAEIITYNTDGFYCRELDVRNEISKSTLRPGGFKYERSAIKFQSSFAPMPLIPDISYRLVPELPSSIPPYELFKNRLTPITLTIGPAGCGKSYNSIEKFPKISSVCLFPTNELCESFGCSNEPKVQTVHMFFCIGTSQHKTQEIVENVIIDEVSMLSEEILTHIENKAAFFRMNIDYLGDVNLHDTSYQGVSPSYQRLPVMGKPRIWGNFRFGNLAETFSFTEEISNIRRQNSEDSKFLDSLRGLTNVEQKVKLLAVLRTHKVHEPLVQDAVGISAIHANISRFNKQALKEWGGSEFPARNIVNTKTDGKNGHVELRPIGKIWFDRTSSKQTIPKEFKYEAAYFRTADAVQGQSISKKILLDLSASNMRLTNYVYSAVTRCRRLEDVLIIVHD